MLSVPHPTPIPEAYPNPPDPERATTGADSYLAEPAHPKLGPANALGYRTPIQEHAPAADTKAAALLTVSGLMFTLVARYSSHLIALVTNGGLLGIACLLLLVAFAVASLAAVAQAFRTISPRFPAAPASLAFFGDIARLSREEYIARVEALSEEQALEQILHFNYTASAICVEKFRQLRRGIRFFQLAFGCWVGLAAFVAVELLG